MLPPKLAIDYVTIKVEYTLEAGFHIDNGIPIYMDIPICSITVLSKKVKKLQLMKHYLYMSVSICLCVAMTTQLTKFVNGGDNDIEF